MRVITCIEDLRRIARRRVPRMFYDYADAGSWTEGTYRANEADFQSILDKVLESLPDVIREAVAEVPVLVTPKPTSDIAERAPHITPDLLGLFVGTSIGEKVAAPSGYGDVVMLFQRNLERAGRSRAEVSKEIKITLLHEYGHYLGFDEEELEHLGLA